jgi:shikimate kinase
VGHARVHVVLCLSCVLTFLWLGVCVRVRRARSIQELVASHGWPHFRAVELDVFRAAVLAHPKRWVIVCGGGIVETPAAADILKVSLQLLACELAAVKQ